MSIKKNKGFGFIELLLVLMAISAAFVFYLNKTPSTEDEKPANQIQNVEKKLDKSMQEATNKLENSLNKSDDNQ